MFCSLRFTCWMCRKHRSATALARWRSSPVPDRLRHGIAVLALVAGCGAAPAQSAAKGADDVLPQAIRDNDIAAAQTALAQHADPNQPLAFGATPLAWAVNTQNPAMVDLLLAHGAKPNTADADGVTPLSLACELGDAGIVAHILDAKADVRRARADGVTPLAICARYGPAEAVARMLAAGAKPDGSDTRGQTPLMWAAASGRVEAMALLMKAGADVNRASKGGFTPLFFAIKSNIVPATDMLLAAGAEAAYRGPENTSAAQLAVYQHNYGAAALLVARGADTTERDREGAQLLHRAAAGGDTALIGALLARGADANALTGKSRITWVTEANFGVAPPPVPPTSPLLIAAANGHEAAMKLLLATGADPRFVAEDGTNIVLAAVRGGSAGTLDFALSLAPDANVANAMGATPLHYLVSGSLQPETEAMMQVLAAHGARTDVKNKRGATPAQIADNGLTEVRMIFRKTFPEKAGVTFADAGGKQAAVAPSPPSSGRAAAPH
jgi:ankyrin repeat protein